MAIARMFEGEGWTADQYDALIDAMDLDGHSAPGVLFHWATVTDRGVLAVDVYDSRESADRLAQEKVGPLTRQLGLPMPVITEHDVRDFLAPRLVA